jgi:aminoglycoside 6'-N-acetyltransferase
MILREANINDLAMLQMWDAQPHVVDSDPNDDWNWEEELSRRPAWREQLIAELDGRPIGFIQIIDPAAEETHYWGEMEDGYKAIDIWIGLDEDLGKGYGTMMMQLALAKCFAEPHVQAVLIDPLTSNERAIHFYQKLGFEFVAERSFGEDVCSVHCINRTVWAKLRIT